MIGRDSREELRAYGPWPWLAGYAVAGILVWSMFYLATGFY